MIDGQSGRCGGVRARSVYIAEVLESRLFLSTYTVMNLNDSGAGSLRDALQQADANPGAGTVNFAASLTASGPATITLGSELVLNGEATISGPGADLLSLDGNNASQVMQVASTASATISGLKITRGFAAAGTSGGGIDNEGTLTLTNSTVVGNSADRGGGILNNGALKLTDSTISGNHGGGISNQSGTATVLNTVVTANSGIGIENDGTLALTNSTVSGSGVGISNYGTLAATDTTVWRNSNVGFYNGNVLLLTNTTVSDNSGLGIFGNGTLTIVNSTIAGNIGGIDDVGGTTAFNAIIAGNSQYDVSSDGSLDPSSSHNLIGGDPKLAVLGDYGGPTLTMPPVAGSPAIDAGENALANGPNGNSLATDQRGQARVVNGTVDIGAVEGSVIPFLPASLIVSTLSDKYDGTFAASNLSLREAIAIASYRDSNDVITFSPGLSGTIVLAGTELQISGDLTIHGPGASTLTFRGSDGSRVFDVGSNATIRIDGITVNGGQPIQGDGGGILNSGVLTVANSTVSGNSARREGGGIANLGTLTLISSTLSANYSTGISDPEEFRGGQGGSIFSSGALTIINSTIAGNSAAAGGGGILNAEGGALMLADSTVSGNSGRSGGGIFNSGALTIARSAVAKNSAGADGGGIYALGMNHSTTITLTSSTVSGNSAGGGAGGIYNGFGALTLIGSYVSSNTAGGDGGGILDFDGTLAVRNSTVSGNMSANLGGGILCGGTALVTDSTISGNATLFEGGGLDNLGTLTMSGTSLSGNTANAGAGISNGGTLTITSSAFSANIATQSGGGGMLNAGRLSLTNSTVSGNSAELGFGGGGILDGAGSLSVTGCTVSHNDADTGGGIRSIDSATGTAILVNTIVAANTHSGSSIADDVAGSIDASQSRFNLIGGGSGGLVNGVNGNLVGIADPKLAPLGDYGGPTQTMPPLPGSPAIDAGSNALALGQDGKPLITDQRGYARYFNGTTDIGAVEYGSSPLQPGDADGDGVVRFSDLLILAQNYGKSAGATWGDGDFNNDGNVNFADLLLLVQNYGRPARSAAARARTK